MRNYSLEAASLLCLHYGTHTSLKNSNSMTIIRFNHVTLATMKTKKVDL